MNRPLPIRSKKIAGHQLTAIFVTALLTWLIGTYWTRQWEESRRLADARVVAFNEILGTFSEQNARSLLVDQAVQHGAPPEDLSGLLRSEQEIFVKARNRAVVLTFTIRELVAPDVYQKIKEATDQGLIDPLDEAMRMHTFIYYQTTKRPKDDDWRKAKAVSDRISVCNKALTNAIWYNTIAPPSDATDQKKKESLQLMEAGCARASG